MKKKKSEKKAKVDLRLNQRWSQIQIQNLIRDHINPMLSNNLSFLEIRAELRRITGKSASQCERYLKQAVDYLKSDFNRDVDELRVEALTALKSDLKESYKNYKDAIQDKDRVLWWKEYQAIKKRITEISPIEKKEKDDSTISVTYQVVEQVPSDK